jgi:hypothetical protein
MHHEHCHEDGKLYFVHACRLFMQTMKHGNPSVLNTTYLHRFDVNVRKREIIRVVSRQMFDMRSTRTCRAMNMSSVRIEQVVSMRIRVIISILNLTHFSLIRRKQSDWFALEEARSFMCFLFNHVCHAVLNMWTWYKHRRESLEYKRQRIE